MGKGRIASPALEAFIDESIKLSKERGYNPTTFQVMRQRYKTIGAIEKLVESGDIQSGFKRLKQLDLSDWSIEAAVMKFPTEFTRNAQKCAKWRLKQLKNK